MSGVLTPTEWAVLGALEEAASKRAPCPKNTELCDLIGASSIATPARIVGKLEELGYIKLWRFSAGREVMICATGLSTKPYAGKRTAHFTTYRVKASPAPARHAQVIAAEPLKARDLSPDDIEQRRVHRDPCPRCGTRGDYGCEHQRFAA